jgi:hypothetical protein
LNRISASDPPAVVDQQYVISVEEGNVETAEVSKRKTEKEVTMAPNSPVAGNETASPHPSLPGWGVIEFAAEVTIKINWK